MIYLLVGTQSLILEKNLKKILNDKYEVLDDFNFVKLNAKETLAQDIAYEASLLPIGYDKKAVVVYNPYFLSTEREKVKFDEEQDLKQLIAYIENPSESTDLFFMANYPKLDERAVITKRIRSHGTVIEVKEFTKNEWPVFVKRHMNKLNVEIEPDAISELILRVDYDVNRFVNEAEKLSLYKKHITKKDIELMVAAPIDANVFNIFESLLHSDNKTALDIYRKLLIQSEEPVRLISLISTQFRTLSKVYALAKEGYTTRDIASELGIVEFRVKLALDNAKYISYKNTLRVLDELYNLDYSIKSMQAPDRFYAFEMWLLNYKNKRK